MVPTKPQLIARMRRSIVVLLASAMVFAPCTTALAYVAPEVTAGTHERVAVLPLAITGELPATWREQLHARVVEGLGRDGRSVASADAAKRCDAHCMQQVASTTGARWVATASVVVHGRDFDVAMVLFDPRDGTRVTESAATCEVCAVAEVGDMLADRAAVLAAKLDAMAEAPPQVRFESVPSGAAVALDGKPIGEAPVERTIEVGRHRVRARLDGYLPLELQFDSTAGTREVVQLELSRLPRRNGMRVGGWVSVGLGLAMVGSGAALLAIDGRQYRDRCSGGDVDPDGDCRFRYDTRTGGAVALSIGAAALVTGITLVVIAARRARGDRRNTSVTR